jgi:hypothetical protein
MSKLQPWQSMQIRFHLLTQEDRLAAKLTISSWTSFPSTIYRVKAVASLPNASTGLRGCLVSGVSTPIKRTLHSTHTEEKTEQRVIIDAATIRQMSCSST